MKTIDGELVSINRKVEIWKAFDQPMLYPCFTNLSPLVQATIHAFVPLNPVYTGSTVLRLYGLTEKQPEDIDLIFPTEEARTAFSKSSLIRRSSESSHDYSGRLLLHKYYCKATGMQMDMIVEPHDKHDIIYSTNMATYPVKEIVQMVLNICNQRNKQKHYERMREIIAVLDSKP